MKPIVLALPLAALMLAAGFYATGQSSAAQPLARGAGPVVIELFQSQGCSSCPPALAVLEQQSRRGDVIALNFAVTYWDHLGWKDGFARPEFTQRQRAYAAAGGRDRVFTPELIVDGRASLVGSERGRVDSAIRAAAHPPRATLSATASGLSVGAAPSRQDATVWLVEYDPRSIQVPIRAGENSGRTLGHRNIVTRLTMLGKWRGTAATFRLPAPSPGKQRVALVQSGEVGPVLAALKL